MGWLGLKRKDQQHDVDIDTAMRDASDALDRLLLDATPKPGRKTLNDYSPDYLPSPKTVTFKSAVSNVFTHVGERMTFLMDHVRHQQISNNHQEIKQTRHIPTPLSCAGYRRGMTRTKSLDSLDKAPPGCVPTWHAHNSVKG